jgi:tRNA(His) guanylyltransferase
MTTLTVDAPGTPLGVRMKEYEHAYRRRLPAQTYTIVRLDGKNFSTYTKNLDKPFDSLFATHMAQTALALCESTAGVAFAYTQSDEISLLLTDFATPATQPWQGGVEAKMLSLSAARATATFNAARPDGGLALFDSRLFTLDDPAEVGNYFLWRQRDALKNSVSMAASAYFSHRRLDTLTTDDRIELLRDEAGIDWHDYPVWARQGQVVRRVPQASETRFLDQRTGTSHTREVVRRPWESCDAPEFKVAPGLWLDSSIPTPPNNA